MDEKLESENSYSGDSSSSTSDSSSGSSECEEEVTESVSILGETLELPQHLCEDYSVFKEFFSMRTWNSLDEKHKAYLSTLLPNFEENEEEEKDTTLEMLFDCEPFHFTSPLNQFYNNLRHGNYRPDIARMRKFLKKARAKQQRHKIKSYYAKVLPEVLLSRERLLTVAKAAPPGPTLQVPNLPTKSSKNTYKPLYIRTRQRYFEELAAIWSEVGCDESDDENYPEGAPDNVIKKRKILNLGQSVDSSVSGTLGGFDSPHPSSVDCLKNVLATHRARRQYKENHPELITTGITLDDIKQRVALVNGAKRLMFGGQKVEAPSQKVRKGSKNANPKSKQDLKAAQKKVKEDDVENKPLLPNIKIKCERDASDSESSTFLDTTSPKHKKLLDNIEIKQEVPDVRYYNNDSDGEVIIKQEPQESLPANINNLKVIQPVPIKLEDLDGIDMMDLPVELVDESGDVVGMNKAVHKKQPTVEDQALTETTHANFLSLVRALFPARAAHRASKQQLHARCAAVMRSPIAPLNTWYNLCDDWCGELNSALEFLAGERGPHPDDYVPYLQYISETQTYQWIGAGRDCDAILGRLCERWLRAASPIPAPREPPPPRYPTNWLVRQPTTNETAEFRGQERRRYSAPSKPFTYVQFGYRSAVGPVTGARGGGALGSAAGALVATQRPRTVAFVPLLRDALARLPNGEGTTRHIVTLLKMSQWIIPSAEQVLSNAVTSVLEKLSSVKREPFVKFDPRTAIWTYLHRHKSEEDWLRSSNVRGRGGKVMPAALSSHLAAEMDVASVEEVIDNASDSDVDVDDTSAPTSVAHLSSAQLLMQATQATSKQVHVPKPKGKLVATPHKPKTTPQKMPPKSSPLQTKPVQTKPVPTKPAPSKPAPPPRVSNHTNPPIQNSKPVAQAKQPSLLTQSPKTNPAVVKNTALKQNPTQTKSIVKQGAPSPKPTPKQNVVVQNVKQNVSCLAKQISDSLMTQMTTTLPSIVIAPQRSPLMKQKSVCKIEPPQMQVTLSTPQQQSAAAASTSQSNAATTQQQHCANSTVKLTQVTRSLLIRPPALQTTAASSAATVSPSTTQLTATPRRSVVRVLSPATPSSGKSLISPRALLQQSSPTAKKRMIHNTQSDSIIVQATASNTATTSVSSSTAGGVTTGARAVQLSNAAALQLSSLQLPAHTVRLPSGQTVQLASPHALQALKMSTPHLKTAPPRTQLSASSIKPLSATSSLQIPVSTVQIAGQTVQIAGQTVQIGGQTVQLTGHTVKLPSGQSVQVASQAQSVQLPSGQTVQIAGGNVQTVQLSGQNVQLSGQAMQVQSGQSVQLGSQTVQIGGQTVQLSGQTVQLSNGQTIQLPGGQTVQLSGGQTLQLSSGQTIQLANQHIPKSVGHVVRAPVGDKSVQPIVAKLLTNAQTQMISLEGGGGAAGARARGVRVLAPARPVLLTAGKPLHNIILQQSDGTAIRVTSAGGTPTSQTIVLSNIGGQGVSTSTATTPVLKLQQVNQIHQVKLPQGIKLQQAVSGAGVGGAGVRSVLMDGQQLKLVGGRHVLARLLRPAAPQPPQPPPQ